MRRITIIVLMLAALAGCHHVAHAESAATTAKAAASDQWPTTRAGDIARRWVEAFGSGEPAMREFYTRYMNDESLAKHGVAERLDRYRKAYDQFGKLMLLSVLESSPERVKAKLATADGSVQTFEFLIQKTAPYKLVTVNRFETRTQHGHGHGLGDWLHH